MAARSRKNIFLFVFEMGREKLLFLLLILLDIILTVKCGGYPPIGDEVQAGSVLLPASRRGRYLANIVRRQAVDGTGIKFNKDADRMNADAKKKVDVLSEELLPYIIAEQERRITLYKRIMAAIQNGEKGVTLAEIRNKPPLIIRKGLMYRCPSNRAPKEPDGSGNLICEGDIEPTAVKFDSCLSAEDKDLYVADNKYFFCNRHKVEGPDLPRNGTAVIGCAPIERTSLNYTSAKCALEDTDDVVVHFRYYPDRSYKFVTELDPDHEVCDHWNPCQIGYIFSLPSPDQATLANELWHDYTEKPEEYERDEIVPAIPEDSYDESFNIRDDEYETSPRRVKIPVGYKYNNVTSGKQSARRSGQLIQIEKIDVQPIEDAFVVVKLLLKKVSDSGSGFAATFYVSFIKSGASDTDKSREIFVKLVRITVGTVRIGFNSLIQMPSEHTQSITIPFDFKKCKLTQIVIRSIDFGIYNLDTSKYKLEDNADSRSKEIRIELDEIKPKDFGYYFAVIENELGHEERYKILSVIPPLPGYEVLKSTRLTISASVGDHVEKTLSYNCEDCTMFSIVCNGENVDTSRISVIPAAKMISFNFPTFEDSNSCVYIGVFNDSHGNIYQQVLAAIDNNSPVVTVESKTVETPKLFKPFEHEVPFSCDDCVVEKVSVNGIPLEMAATRRSASSPMEFYTASQSEITIHITEFTKMFEGVYQAVFSVKGEMITKTILEIRDPKNNNEDSTHNEKDKGEDKSDDKDEDKPTEKPKEKTEEKSEDKNEEKSHDKHEDKIEDKHEENSTKKPEDKSSHDAEEKSTGKPEEKHEENPAENTSEKPAEHIEEKPAENLLLKNQQDKITHNIATATVTTNSLHTQ